MAKNKRHSLSNVDQKASKRAPFLLLNLRNIFVFALFSINPALQAHPVSTASNCSANHFQESVIADYVYDGDTIHLSDGRKLRLIGINTTEHGRDGKADEPFYAAAKRQLKQIIDKSHGQLKLLYGKDKLDHYQRLLAYIFTPEGKNIAAILLKQGLGYSIAIPPNLKFLKCFQEAEQEAKSLKLGLWNHPFGQAVEVSGLDKSYTGFRQVAGTVQRIGESRSAVWLDLDKTFSLRIPKKDLANFKAYPLATLKHKHIIARGWIYRENHQQRISIRHPASLQIQNTD